MQPCHVGDLPTQLAALNLSNISVQEMCVTAALAGDRRMAMQAVLLDPLTAAILTPAQIEQMVDEMLASQTDLPRLLAVSARTARASQGPPSQETPMIIDAHTAHLRPLGWRRG